jgi:hypothetical protein
MLSLMIGASLISAIGCSGVASDGVVCSELTTPAGHATIVQSGPGVKKAKVRKEVGPGYSVLEQDSGGNHTIIIQTGPGSN